MPVGTHNAKLIKLPPLLIISMPAKLRDGSRVHEKIKYSMLTQLLAEI
jgi:hypothetical protein